MTLAVRHPPSAPRPDAQPEEIGVRDAARILRGRWLTIFLCTALALAGAILYVVFSTPIYRSSAAIRVDQPQARFSVNNVAQPIERENQVETELEELKGRQLVREVVTALNLHVGGRQGTVEATVDTLIRALHVTRPNFNANVIVVEFEHRNPRVARDVVNTLLERFLLRRQGAQTSEAASAAEFLRQQLDSVDRQLAVSEQTLRTFRQSQRIADLPTQAASDVARMAELQAQRTQLDSERRALASLLDEVRAEERAQGPAAPSPYRRLVAFPTLFRNQATAGLLAGLASAEDARSQLLMRRTMADPDVVVLTSRIREHETQLRDITVTYLRGLDAQVRALDAPLAQLGQRLARLPARQIEDARLERSPVALAQIRSALLTRLKEAEVAEAVVDPSIRVIDPASLPQRPVKPRRSLVLGLALLLGLATGLTLAFMRAQFDRRIYDRGQAQLISGAPVIGVIPHMRGGTITDPKKRGKPLPRRWRLLPPDKPKAGAGTAMGPAQAEIFRRVRSTLEGMARTGRGRTGTLLITSPGAGDGKTTAAANLALAFAQQGDRTLLLDTDFGGAGLTRFFGLEGEPGVAEVLSGSMPIHAALRRVDLEPGVGFDIIAAGKATSGISSRLGTELMRAVMAEAQGHYDTVIIDSRAMAVAADADAIAPYVEGVLLVVRAGATEAGSLAESVQQLQVVGARLVGLILNDLGNGNGMSQSSRSESRAAARLRDRQNA